AVRRVGARLLRRDRRGRALLALGHGCADLHDLGGLVFVSGVGAGQLDRFRNLVVDGVAQVCFVLRQRSQGDDEICDVLTQRSIVDRRRLALQAVQIGLRGGDALSLIAVAAIVLLAVGDQLALLHDRVLARRRYRLLAGDRRDGSARRHSLTWG